MDFSGPIWVIHMLMHVNQKLLSTHPKYDREWECLVQEIQSKQTGLNEIKTRALFFVN